MASFNSKLAKHKYETNVVLKIGTVYFSQKRVDSGIVMDEDKTGLVIDVNVSPTTFEIRGSQTSIATLNFSLLDKDGLISQLIMQSEDSWINREVICYIGFVNSSFSFSQYKILSHTRIKSIDKQSCTYTFQAVEPTQYLLKPMFTTFSGLVDDITDLNTSLELEDASSFPTEGLLNLDGEFISWDGKAVNVLQNLVRGELGSEAKEHDAGDLCYLVTKKEDSSVNILLDILIDELEIDESLINIASFLNIGNILNTDGDFTLYLYNIENALSYIEDNILLATNTRFYTKDGQICLAILDQATTHTAEITEDSIRGLPNYSIDGDKLVNNIIVKLDYNWGQNKFAKTLTFEEASSIALFGRSTPLIYEFKGITTANGGVFMANNRANRILARLSTPRATISATTHFDMYNIKPADIVLFRHRHLPMQGTGLGINDVVEVMSTATRGIKDDPRIDMKLEYTSFANYIIGVISPSPALTGSITNQKTFEVPDGSFYEVGYALRIWDNVNHEYFADPVNYIESINGNELTMEDDFVTELGANVSLFFAHYDDCSYGQRFLYAFTSPDSGFFADGKQCYRITY